MVNSGHTWTTFVAGGGDWKKFSTMFGYDSTHYDSPTLTKPLEIIGSTRVMLEVSPQASASDYQLHCVLYEVDAKGVERTLQRGLAAVKGNSKAQRLTVDFFVARAIHVLAGNKLRLRIENYSDVTIPFFKNAVKRGTKLIVEMRELALGEDGRRSAFSALDDDLFHLLTSWFNRGFLVLRRIDT